MVRLWRVTGSAGLLVREAAALRSPALEERLKQGAVVEEVGPVYLVWSSFLA